MIYILLAAFNEEEALPLLLKDISNLATEGQWDYRIIVVNDGSTDNTAQRLDEVKGSLPLTILAHDPNRGLAAAMKTGLLATCQMASSEDVVVTLDADHTHPAYLIKPMETLIANGFDVVIASRFVSGGEEVGVSPLRRVMSRGARLFFRMFLRCGRVQDYTCGFRAYRAGLLQSAIQFYGDDFICSPGFSVTAELLLNLRRWKPRIAEIPLVLRYDEKPGASKIKLGQTIRGTLGLITLAKWRRL